MIISALQTGNRVYLKPENLQFTGAYKLRGAYYKMSTLTDEERAKGLITASAGNHAQGVAYDGLGIRKNRTIGEIKCQMPLPFVVFKYNSA